jgi:hypothetical protein
MKHEATDRFRVAKAPNPIQGTREECEQFIEEAGEGQLERLFLHGPDDLTAGHWQRV